MMIDKDIEEFDLKKAETLFQKREYNKCQNALNGLLSQFPQNPDLYLLLGKTYAALNMHRESINYFLICLDLQPSNYRYYKEYAEVLLEFDKLQHAEEYIRQAIKLKKNSSECYMCLGKILMQSFKIHQAKQAFQKCQSLSPGNEKVLKYLQKIDKKLIMHQREQKRFKIQAQQAIIPQKVAQEKEKNGNQSLMKEIKELQKKIDIKEEEIRVQNLCKICYDQPSQYVNLKCGHLCLGALCVEQVKKVCPFCKTKGKYMRVFT